MNTSTELSLLLRSKCSVREAGACSASGAGLSWCMVLSPYRNFHDWVYPGTSSQIQLFSLTLPLSDIFLWRFISFVSFYLYASFIRMYLCAVYLRVVPMEIRRGSVPCGTGVTNVYVPYSRKKNCFEQRKIHINFNIGKPSYALLHVSLSKDRDL